MRVAEPSFCPEKKRGDNSAGLVSPFQTAITAAREGKMRVRLLAAILASTAATIGLSVPAASAETGQQSYDIAPQDLADALRQYSELSGRDVIANSEIVARKKSARVSGNFTADAALEQLLAGTGLVAESVDGTLVIREGKGD